MTIILLPFPKKVSSVSVEEAILLRRSVREFSPDPITVEQLSMLLWAAYGVTDPKHGFRSSPSAGATYPLEIYVVVGEKSVLTNSTYLEPAIYKYNGRAHAIELIKHGDYREALSKAALNQPWVREAPIDIVITAVFERTTRFYGERGRIRYVPMDVGHAGQNIYLMATALHLGTVAIGAFDDRRVAEILTLKSGETPMYIMPIGKPRTQRKAEFADIARYIESVRKGVA